ncbi:hypothetical protein RD792_002047 [Penstemon davidsonii]|uniref:BTB domain-containing protein n=1 Tax=Penstemon davidsonii TaxID=160366 RepID=A0ABR0DQ18_9LAMI|nr:hypothetical protein RD792_002047 [Penstemon davidsonii]
MLDTKTKKRPGRSTIQIEEKIHEFAAGDRSRESASVIYDVLDEVTREARVQGYMPYFEYVVVNIENEDEYNFMVEDMVIKELEASQFIKDDFLPIQCTVGVLMKTSMDGPKAFAQPLRLSDLRESYMQLLESKEGSDVTFEVEGEIFYAHRLNLATRSPVFKAQFFCSLKEENTRCIKIEEMHAPVFKVHHNSLYFWSIE